MFHGPKEIFAPSIKEITIGLDHKQTSSHKFGLSGLRMLKHLAWHNMLLLESPVGLYQPKLIFNLMQSV